MVDHTVTVRPRARLDMIELAAYIGENSVPSASRFLKACEATFGLLKDSPELGGVYLSENRQLSGLRAFRVTGFPNHLVFYAVRSGNGIEIVRVVHGARDLDATLEDE